MKLKIKADICIVYENRIIRLAVNAEVIIVYDDDNDTWRFDIHYN